MNVDDTRKVILDPETPLIVRIIAGGSIGMLVGYFNRNDHDFPGYLFNSVIGAGLGLVIGIYFMLFGPKGETIGDHKRVVLERKIGEAEIEFGPDPEGVLILKAREHFQNKEFKECAEAFNSVHNSKILTKADRKMWKNAERRMNV